MVALLPVGAGHPFNGVIVGFGSATGEDHLLSVASQHSGQLAPSMVNRGGGGLAVVVAAGWIAEVLVEIGKHGLGYLGVDGCSGVVVQINRAHKGAPAGKGLDIGREMAIL